MEIPLKVTCRNFAPPPGIEETIARQAADLERFCARITSCRVTASLPSRHHREGTPYSVRIDVTVPGREIVVSRRHRRDPRNTNLEFAVEGAFHAMRRKLEDHVEERRGSVKEHVTPAHGRVAKLFPESGYGFVETGDGEEIHFDLRSVIEGAERIAPGVEVRFVREEADKGPNATSVRVVGRHHHIEPVLAPQGGQKRKSSSRRSAVVA